MLSDLEHQNRLGDRRSFMKLLAAAPLFATIGARSFAAGVCRRQDRWFKKGLFRTTSTRA